MTKSAGRREADEKLGAVGRTNRCHNLVPAELHARSERHQREIARIEADCMDFIIVQAAGTVQSRNRRSPLRPVSSTRTGAPKFKP